MTAAKIFGVSVVALFACRGGEGSADAVPESDASGGDAAETDASLPAIRVMAFDEDNPGQPASGARVIFAAPGEPPREVVTNADGTAEVFSSPGTTVTVVQSYSYPPGAPALTAFASFVGLVPGDSVVAGPRRPRPQTAASFTVVMPEHPEGHFYLVSASCPTQGHADLNVISVTYFEPCDTSASATLIGRVRDSSNAQLAVSVLEGVDLTAVDGTTIMMPPFLPLPTTIAATLTNVSTETAGPTLFTRYRLGDGPVILEEVSDASIGTGIVELETVGYPVGDRTTFDLLLQHHAAPFSSYHHWENGRVTSFTFDASSMIKALLNATATPQTIEWTETATGSDATFVAAAVRWDGTRGIIVAPHTGSSLPLDVLPPGIRPREAPQLVEFQLYAVDGASYRDVVSLIEQSRDFTSRVITLPLDVTYWRTSYPFDI